MNSFKFVADGIAAELERQEASYERGEELTQDTLHYDPGAGTVVSLRSKEYADDYRYFPEPDLVPVEPPPEMIEAMRGELGELPGARIRRLEAEVARLEGDRRAVANVLMNQFAASGADPERVNAEELGKLIAARERIPRKTFDEALAASGNGEFSAERYLADATISDASELDPVIERVLAANESQVASFKAGKEGVLGYLVGQVMRETEGKANPKVVNERLREKLSI
jgi:aspartyl-tRNA(Asn)/glutamyl-tRNA(Gln) amidotransferase subunit B